MALREEQFTCHDVLADRTDVRVRRDGGAELHLVSDEVELFAHHDRIEMVGKRSSRVDRCILVLRQAERRGFSCADRPLRTHGDPVHGRRVKGGRRCRCPDGFGGGESQSFAKREPNRFELARAAFSLPIVLPPLDRLPEREVLKEVPVRLPIHGALLRVEDDLNAIARV